MGLFRRRPRAERTGGDIFVNWSTSYDLVDDSFPPVLSPDELPDFGPPANLPPDPPPPQVDRLMIGYIEQAQRPFTGPYSEPAPVSHIDPVEQLRHSPLAQRGEVAYENRRAAMSICTIDPHDRLLVSFQGGDWDVRVVPGSLPVPPELMPDDMLLESLRAVPVACGDCIGCHAGNPCWTPLREQACRGCRRIPGEGCVCG